MHYNCQCVLIVPGRINFWRKAEFNLKVNSKHSFLSETENKNGIYNGSSLFLLLHRQAETGKKNPDWNNVRHLTAANQKLKLSGFHNAQ